MSAPSGETPGDLRERTLKGDDIPGLAMALGLLLNSRHTSPGSETLEILFNQFMPSVPLNGADQNQMPKNVWSDQGLQCLHTSLYKKT